MVDRISIEITQNQFQDLYLNPNKPCVLTEVFTRDWRSRREWVHNGKPNFEYLSDKFGDASIPVANCSKKEFNSHEKVTMKLREFLAYWKNMMQAEDDKNLLYLKDWHFQRDFPDYRAYEVLRYFQSDWLNEWYDQNDKDDYRFVYMGPKGTWTAFHADVLRSYSWSANICGRKRWLLYPPNEEQSFKDRLGNLPFDVTSSEMKDAEKYPNFNKAIQPIEIIQEEGEVVFIPSCWHHQVHNLEHTISINHNWTNAHGIKFMLRHLQDELLLVEKEIWEFRDTEGWQDQCQLLLKCTAGMDYDEFAKMLVDLMKPRFELLKQYTEAKAKCRAMPKKRTQSQKESMNIFKRFQVTCVPKEHLNFSIEDDFDEIVDLENIDKALLEIKLQEVGFDLLKLTETYRSLYVGLKSDGHFKFLEESFNFVENVEKFLSTRISKS